MFRFIKRLILLTLVLVIALIAVILFLPKNYEREHIVNIARPKSEVFRMAQNLKTWNLMAMAEGLDIKMPDKLPSPVQIQGVQTDSLLAMFRGLGELADIRCRIIETDEPNRLQMELTGGPLNGLKPELTFKEVDDKTTLVALKEAYQFEGWMGGLKAFSARFAMDKVNAQNLENLKKICEQTR